MVKLYVCSQHQYYRRVQWCEWNSELKDCLLGQISHDQPTSIICCIGFLTVFCLEVVHIPVRHKTKQIIPCWFSTDFTDTVDLKVNSLLAMRNGREKAAGPNGFTQPCVGLHTAPWDSCKRRRRAGTDTGHCPTYKHHNHILSLKFIFTIMLMLWRVCVVCKGRNGPGSEGAIVAVKWLKASPV